jgi:hypothetical protein
MSETKTKIEVKMNEQERILVDEYGFKVTTKPVGGVFGDHFVVTDPKLPKNIKMRMGGNLYALLCDALDARQEFEQKVPFAAKGKAIADEVKQHLGQIIPHADRAIHGLEPFDPYLEGFENAPSSNGLEVTSVAKVEKATTAVTPTKKVGKIHAMKHVIWEDPWAKPEEILEQLENQGITSNVGVISGFRSDFFDSIRVLHELGVVSDEHLAHIAKK